MLDFIRKRQDSIIVKLIFGVLLLAFILFFGSDFLRKGVSGQNSSPAKVNGTDINGQKFSFLVDSQLDELRSSVTGQIPDSYVEMVRNNITNNLLNIEVISQEALKLGVVTSNNELQQSIKANPQFQQDGKFAKDTYLNRFLPWYRQTHGTSFENDYRDELSRQKILGLFDDVASFTGDELKQVHKSQNTFYQFSVIKVPREKGLDAKEPLPKEIDVKEAPVSGQKELAESLLSTWQKSQPLDTLLKDNNLEQSKTKDLTLTELKTVFDGTQDVPLIRSLTQLSGKSPFVAKPLELGNFFYLVKLEKLTAAKAPTPDELKALKEQLSTQLASFLESTWIKDLRRSAEIVIR